MSAIKGARERARAEITAAIKEEARQQLAERGAAELSLRAVARELGMASSALYRYFPSRDELLTALIVDAFDAIGAAAEDALRRSAPPRPPLERWTAVCTAVRAWALKHPHEYALIYGSPVPGYAAPEDTMAPASRVGVALITVVLEARAAGAAGPPEEMARPVEIKADLDRLRALLDQQGGAPPELGEVLDDRLIAAWAGLFGLISFEVFGQFNQVIEARDAFFGLAVARLGLGLGLPATTDCAGPETPQEASAGSGSSAGS